MSNRKTERRGGAGKSIAAKNHMLSQGVLRSKPAFGYKITGTGKNRRIVINPTQASLVREAYRRIIAGDGLAQICKDWTNKGFRTSRGTPWRASNLRQLLKRPTFMAKIKYNNILHNAPFEAIVYASTWYRCQQALKSRHVPASKDTPPAVLSGLLICGQCSEKLQADPKALAWAHYCHTTKVAGKKKGKVSIYRCQTSSKLGSTHCKAPLLQGDIIEQFVTKTIKCMYDMDYVSMIQERVKPDHLTQKVEATEAELSEQQDILKRLAKDYANNLLDDTSYTKAFEEASRRLHTANETLNELKERFDLNIDEAQKALGKAKMIDDLTKKEKRSLIHKLIKKIEIHPDWVITTTQLACDYPFDVPLERGRKRIAYPNYVDTQNLKELLSNALSSAEAEAEEKEELTQEERVIRHMSFLERNRNNILSISNRYHLCRGQGIIVVSEIEFIHDESRPFDMLFRIARRGSKSFQEYIKYFMYKGWASLISHDPGYQVGVVIDLEGVGVSCYIVGKQVNPN